MIVFKDFVLTNGEQVTVNLMQIVKVLPISSSVSAVYLSNGETLKINVNYDNLRTALIGYLSPTL